MTRMAISPRFATRTLVNIRGSERLSSGHDARPHARGHRGRRGRTRRFRRGAGARLPAAPAHVRARCSAVAWPCRWTAPAPAGGSVSLYVERRRAARRPARGVTLLLAGRPGPARHRRLQRPARRNPYGEFRALTPRNDIVAFDGRGTGRSGLLRCPELERASLTDAGAEAAACARRLGPRRAFYRTSDSVEDIEAVRAALGVEQADADRRLVRDVRRPGLRGALPGPRGARAARLGARRVGLGSVLPRRLRGHPARAAVGVPRRLPAVHRRRRGRPRPPGHSPRRPQPARPRDAAQRAPARGRR